MEAKARRLTELTETAGCGSKTGAKDLEQILRGLVNRPPGCSAAGLGDVLVGLSSLDDAAAYRLAPDLGVVLTVDFSPPIVDDPYSFGAIAAANAMSDVYAMGADVRLALNVAAFPIDLAAAVASEILRGGADKVEEAGGVVVGGHTLIDEQPMYGLCVLGVVHPERILRKAGAQPGDILCLTKPLGTGIITTAAKFEEANQEDLRGAIDSMLSLNGSAARIVREVGIHALTDVTGYGLLGHSYEMATASGHRFRIEASAVPLLAGAVDCAYRGIVTGGGLRSRRYLEDKVDMTEAIPAGLQEILYDPQTSGGLLFAVAADRVAEVEARFRGADLPLWRIGEVLVGEGVAVT